MRHIIGWTLIIHSSCKFPPDGFSRPPGFTAVIRHRHRIALARAICTRQLGYLVRRRRVSNAAASAIPFSKQLQGWMEFSQNMNGLAVQCGPVTVGAPTRAISRAALLITGRLKSHRFLSRHRHGVATGDHPTVAIITSSTVSRPRAISFASRIFSRSL